MPFAKPLNPTASIAAGATSVDHRSLLGVRAPDLGSASRLRATRIYQMVRERGYAGSVVQLRRAVARLRPPVREAFLRLHTFPADQAQVDWAHFGHVAVGRARRALSCFLITLSYSRALYLEFFFDQTMENFPARACPRLSRLGRPAPRDSL